MKKNRVKDHAPTEAHDFAPRGITPALLELNGLEHTNGHKAGKRAGKGRPLHVELQTQPSASDSTKAGRMVAYAPERPEEPLLRACELGYPSEHTIRNSQQRPGIKAAGKAKEITTRTTPRSTSSTNTPDHLIGSGVQFQSMSIDRYLRHRSKDC